MKIWFAKEWNRVHDAATKSAAEAEARVKLDPWDMMAETRAKIARAEREHAEKMARAAKDRSDEWVAVKARTCLEGLGMPDDVARLMEARIAAALRDALGVGL